MCAANFSQLALSSDTVGSVSMKDDDIDNLRNEACKVRGGGETALGV